MSLSFLLATPCDLYKSVLFFHTGLFSLGDLLCSLENPWNFPLLSRALLSAAAYLFLFFAEANLCLAMSSAGFICG